MTRQTSRAASITPRGFADLLRLQFLDRFAQFLDAGNKGGIRRDRGIEQDRCAFALGDIALIVKGDFELAEIFRIGLCLNDRHIPAGRALDQRRIGAERFRVGVGQQRMAVAADNHIDAVNLCRKLLVPEIAVMVDRDDLVDAFGLQRVDQFLQCLDFIGKFDIGPGLEISAVSGGQGGNDADLLAADFLDEIGFEFSGDGRIRGDFDVAGNDREFHLVEKFAQA